MFKIKAFSAVKVMKMEILGNYFQSYKTDLNMD